MQEFEDSVPSLLQLLENTPEPPVFCFHEAVMGHTHQCSLLPCETIQGGPKEGERASLDCSREKDSNPTTNKHLKSFILSSTPLRKVCSPQNLVLDSDVEGGWSFSMATPASHRQGVKGPPLSLTADGESSTLFESTGEDSLLAVPKELSNSCEKLRNRVVILPGEKPLARTLFPRVASPIRVDGDYSSHIQRFHSRFEHCAFSPIPLSPLVSSQHRDTTAAKEPLVQDADCSAVSVSLFGGDSVLLDSLCVTKQEAKKPLTEEGEEEEERCSQELFGSPEVLSDTEREEGESDKRSCPVKQQDNQEYSKKKGSLQPHSSDFQQPFGRFPASQAISVQETPISQRQHSHPARPQPDNCSTPHPLRHCPETFSPLHFSCTATSVQETPSHHNSVLPSQHTLIQSDKDSILCVDKKAEYSLDKTDVLDLLFMSCSQLDTPVSKKQNTHRTIPSPSFPLPTIPPASTTSAKLPYIPPSSATIARNTSTNAESKHSKEDTENSVIVAGKSAINLGEKVSLQTKLGTTPVSDATRKHQLTTDSAQGQIMAEVSDGAQRQQLAAQVSDDVQKQQLTAEVSGGEEKQQLAAEAFGGVQKQFTGEVSDGTQKQQLTPEGSGGAEKHQLTAEVLGGAEKQQLTAEVLGGAEKQQLTAEVLGGAEKQQLTAEASGGTEKQLLTAEVSGVCMESDHLHVRDKLLGRDPQAKRRRLSTKTFLYPGTKPLSSRRKGRKKVERLTSPVSASENMDVVGNFSVGISSEHVNQSIQQFSGMSRRRRSGVVSNTKPPAKKVCLEDASVELVRTEEEVESVVPGRVSGGVHSGERNPNSCAETESVKEDFSADPLLVSSEKAGNSKQVLQVPNLGTSVNTTPGTPAVTSTLVTNCTVATPTIGLGARQPKCELATELPVQLPDKPKQHEQQLDSVRDSRPISKKRVKAPGLRRRTQHRSSAPFLLTSSSTPQESFVSRVADPATNVFETDPMVEVCSSELHGTESTFSANGLTKATTDAAPEKKPIDDAKSLLPEESLSIKSLAKDSPMDNSPVTPCDTFVGFQMASGKAVCISKQAMRRAQKLMDEKVVGEDTNKESVGGLNSATPLGKNVSKKIIISGTPLSNEHSTPSTCGVKTPHLPSSKSGAKLTSQSAFKAPLSSTVTPSGLYASVLPPRNALSTGRRLAARSFKAPRKASSVSKNEEAASLARILRKFGTAETKSTRVVKNRGEGGGKSSGTKAGSEPACNTGMFVTAGGRKLSVSTSAMQRAQQIFMDDKENGLEALLQSGSHQSAPPLNQIVGAGVSPPAPTPELSIPKVQLSGFTTASGRELTVSAAAMEHACNILSMTGQDTNPNLGSMETASKVCHSNSDVESGKETVCIGFQTASGKSLSVSLESLSRAESLVAGAAIGGPECGSETCEGSVKTGFQTAGGKGIAVSARTLLDAKKLMPLEGEMALGGQETIPFQSERVPSDHSVHETGFQTANGCQISVWAQSLQHAKCLFEKEPLLHESTPLITGFQTAAGRTLSVSTSSLQHAQDMLVSEFQASLNPSGVNSTHFTKTLPSFAPCTEDVHSESVSEQCQALSAEDLDDLDIDNLGAFTQINFHALEEAKGKELLENDRTGESLRQGDEACCVPLEFVQDEITSQCWDSGSSDRRGNPAQEYGVHKDGMSAQASSSVSPPDEQLQLLTSGNGPSVPDVEGVDPGCYFSTQMVRQFLDFSSSDEEEEKKEVEENEEGEKREGEEEEKEEEVKEKTEVEENRKEREKKKEGEEKEKVEENENEQKKKGEEIEKKEEGEEECWQLELPNKAIDTVMPQLIPASSHVSTKVVRRREEGEEEEASQMTESQCLAVETPSEYGGDSLRNACISGSVDAVGLAVDRLFDAFPDNDSFISLNVSEVAAAESDTHPLQQTLDNCNKLPPSHSPLDLPDVPMTKHAVLKETSTLSPSCATSTFHPSSQDMEEVVCGSYEESASSKVALQTFQDTVKCGMPECTPDLKRLVDSYPVREQLVDSSSLMSGPPSPIANETKTALKSNQDVHVVADHLQQTFLPTTTGPANVSNLDTSLEGESSGESSKGSLLNEVMVGNLEGRVDTLTFVKRDSEGWCVISEGEAYQSEKPSLLEQCGSPSGSQQTHSPYTNMQLLKSSHSPYNDIQSLKSSHSPYNDMLSQLPHSPHSEDLPQSPKSSYSSHTDLQSLEPLHSPQTDIQSLQPLHSPHADIQTLQPLHSPQADIQTLQPLHSPQTDIQTLQPLHSPYAEDIPQSLQLLHSLDTNNAPRLQLLHSPRTDSTPQSVPTELSSGVELITVAKEQPVVRGGQVTGQPLQPSTRFTVGLQTASGHAVHISEEALSTVRWTLGSTADESNSAMGHLASSDGRAVSQEAPAEDRGSPDGSVHVTPSPSCTGFLGLQTDGGKKVEISEEALSQARSVLGEAEQQKVSPSLEIAKQIKPVTEGVDVCHSGRGFLGFLTASGNKVEVSEHSLKVVKQLLHQSSPATTMTSPQASSVSQPQAVMRKADCAAPKEEGTRFPGLQTASGSRVEISEGSLLAARRTLHSDTSCTQGPTQRGPCGGFPGLQTASGSTVEISEASLKAARRTLHSNTSCSYTQGPTQRGPCGGFPRLQTASGSTLEISEASLKVARRTLHGDASCSDSTARGSFPGLLTASGSRVEISEASLKAVREVIHGEQTGSSVPGSKYPGLMTAKGEKVNITEDALRAAKSTLQLDSDQHHSPKSVSPGLPMDDGNTSLSATSLSGKSMQHSSSEVSCQAPVKHSTFSGLQTANGREVTISEQSLAAVRSNLSCSQLHSRGTSSLMTASEKSVPVSETALKAVKLAVGGTTTSLVEGTPSAMLGHEGNGSGQTGFVSPIRTENITTVPLNYHKKTFPSSQSLPDSLQATRAPQAAKGKYKPVFHSMGRREGSHPPTAHSSPAFQQPHPSQLHTPQPHFSQSHTPRIQGTTTTPEALLHDRSSRRPLLPMQTFLNQDGSYVSATPTRRFHRLSDSAARHTHQQQPPMSVIPQPHFSNPTLGPPLSHSHVSTPRPNFHVPCSTGTPQHQQKYFNSVSRPQNLSVNRVSSVGRTVEFATPRRSVRQKSTCTPVWRSSARSATRGSSSSRTAPYPSKRQSVLAQQSPLHPTNMSFPSSDGKGTLPPSSNQLVTSTQSSNPSDRAVSPNSTTRKHSSDGGSSMTTSTQIASQDQITHICPLSPINITLSQICALENSQLETTQVEENHEGERGGGKREEDSGYLSKNQIDSRSPGIECTAHGVLFNSINKTTSPAVVQSYDMEDSAVFAEIATELLNDSLDEDVGEVDEGTSHVKHQMTVPQPPNRITPCPPKVSHHAHPQFRIPSNYHDNTHQGTSVCAPPPPPSGPIKPQTGSLLASRMVHSSQRIPLTSAVRTPPGRYSLEQLHSLGVHPSVVEVSVRSAVEFKFGGFQYFSAAVLNGSPVCVGDGAMLRLKDSFAGVSEFWEAFSQSPGVDPKLISFEWFANHYKWVVWKLASLEVAFPHQFAGQCLTPDWLMVQLKYRYDREIDRAERSAFHKIFEQDDIPSRTMVVCVSAVDMEKLNSMEHCDKNSSKTEKDGSLVDGDNSLSSNPPCIEVTDGWYSMPAVLDTPLERMVRCGKISLGTKLITYGAEILGGSDPTPPLEAPASLALRLHGNSTRRARWFLRLGYQRLPHPFPVPLMSVFPDGGLVGCVDVVVVRVYPLVCMEKVEGRSIFRKERVEARLRASHEAARQREIEKICARVQKDFEEEMAKEESEHVTSRRRSRRRLNTLQVKQLQDGEEIYNALMNAPDPTAFQELLTRTQRTLLESYHLSVQSQRQAELERRIRQAIEEAEEELPSPRNVVPLLRARLVPLKPHSSPFNCHLSVWRPGEEVKSVIKEGRALRMFNINATPSRYKPAQRLQLTASRSTRYEEILMPPDQLRMSYTPRHCTAIAAISHVELVWGEFDTVGIVVCITTANIPSTERADRLLASVYLADDSGGLLVVKVWDGLKAHALEDLVVPGMLVAVSNLSYQGLGYAHHLPSANAGEGSVFSQHPREQHLKSALQELSRNMPDKRKEYLQSLEERINF